MAFICSITKEPIDQLGIVVPCGCKFEYSAISEWVKNNSTCPNERMPIQGINRVARPVVDASFYLPQDRARRFRQLVILTYRVHEAEHPEVFQNAQQVKALSYNLFTKISGNDRVEFSNDELYKLKQTILSYSAKPDYKGTNDQNRMGVIQQHLKSAAG